MVVQARLRGKELLHGLLVLLAQAAEEINDGDVGKFQSLGLADA